MLGLLHEERHKRERTLSFVKHHEIVFRFVYPHLIFVPQAEPPEHLEYSFEGLGDDGGPLLSGALLWLPWLPLTL